MIWRILKAILKGVDLNVSVKGDILTVRIQYGTHTIFERTIDFIPD